MSKNNDVKPCPYCGGNAILVSESPWFGGVTNVDIRTERLGYRFYVVCTDERCQARGPVSEKESDAIAMWNLLPHDLAAFCNELECMEVERFFLQRMTRFLAAGAQPCLTGECPEGLNGECNRFSRKAIQCNLKYAKLKAEKEIEDEEDDCY